VTTVQPQDVPRSSNACHTGWFSHANINAQVQGYIVSRDYQEGGVVKKVIYFSDRFPPVRSRIGTGQRNSAKDKANQVKADADEKRAMDVQQKSDQRPGARYLHSRGPKRKSKHPSRRAAVMQAELI